ncbi:hypothetical protein GCM10010327_20280 [Streptomyces nitrosporeus]|nr:hypothetical protein GCM10010327_20280 [Streptomyces nitrosporeus]
MRCRDLAAEGAHSGPGTRESAARNRHPAVDTGRSPRGAMVCRRVVRGISAVERAGTPPGAPSAGRHPCSAGGPPGARPRTTDADGVRITCFATGAPGRPVTGSELRHRLRARAEDRVRAARAAGPRNA